MAQKDKQKKEEDLKKLAEKARQERSGIHAGLFFLQIFMVLFKKAIVDQDAVHVHGKPVVLMYLFWLNYFTSTTIA